MQCEPMHPDAQGWSRWVHPLKGYLMQCCDCGLIHEMEFAIDAPYGDTPSNEGENQTRVIIMRARRWPVDGIDPDPSLLEQLINQGRAEQ